MPEQQGRCAIRTGGFAAQTAAEEAKAAAAAIDLSGYVLTTTFEAYKEEVGDTDTDFASAYTTARDGTSGS